MDNSKLTGSFSINVINNEYLALSSIILLSVACRTPLIFQGFAEFDGACIAASIIDFISHGKDGHFTNLYFLDVIPGYVIYIKMFMKLLDNNYKYLTTVINYTNVVIGTLMTIPCYYFVKRLFNNKSIAFCTTLTFVFVPSVFQYSIYGFPHLIALFFFITSLYFFLVWLDNEGLKFLILSFVTLTATIFFKSDFALGVGAYLGLLCMRRTKDKHKIVLTLCTIAFSIVFFLLLRQLTMGHQYEGPELGSTASLSNFLKWGEYFFGRVYTEFYNKNYYYFVRTQIEPIIYGIGVLNFFIAGFVFIYFLIKRRYHILLFVIFWSAIPTTLWLLIHGNSARHNMLSVLPFLIIIFLLIYEKSPRLIVLFSVILIVGNFLLTSSHPITDFKGVKFLQSQIQLRERVNDLHLIARRIAHLENDKIMFITPTLKPYLLFELFSSMPLYTTEKIDDYCYTISNRKSLLCLKVARDELVSLVKNDQLEGYTIIAPSFDLHFLREDGFKVIDNTDIHSWINLRGSIPLKS